MGFNINFFGNHSPCRIEEIRIIILGYKLLPFLCLKRPFWENLIRSSLRTICCVKGLLYKSQNRRLPGCLWYLISWNASISFSALPRETCTSDSHTNSTLLWKRKDVGVYITVPTKDDEKQEPCADRQGLLPWVYSEPWVSCRWFV
jgi:hypothetical protein